MSWPERPHHLLLLTARLANPERPEWLSNNLYDFAGSFEASGLGHCTLVHGDAHTIVCQGNSYSWTADDDVVELCRRTRPDLIVISEVRAPDVDGHSLPRNLYLTNLHPLTLSYLRYVLRIPLVLLWYDTNGDDFLRMERRYPMVDLHVVLDHGPFAPYTRQPERYCHLWTPQDTRIVHDPGGERPIDVSFAGRIETDRYAYRRHVLDGLRANGLSVYTRPDVGDEVSHAPYAEYIAVLQQSKMTINFSSHGQLKGRVFEALQCGTFLLEPDHTPAWAYFEPRAEYMPYSSTDDLAGLVRYYVEHEDERRGIASHGHARAVREYGPDAFWMTLWEALRVRAESSIGHPLRFPE